MWYSKYLKFFSQSPIKKSNLMEITGKVQKYDWGKKGQHSKVAELHKNVNSDFMIDADTPYAELWLGTHVSGPSEVKTDGKSLAVVIKEKPSVLGHKIKKAFGIDDLPFLFKVLSIEKALSIQVHPDKERAEKLHLLFPNIYKDSNHKPEIAIALTPFEALCGFRPYFEIKHFFKSIPELRELVGLDLCDRFLDSFVDDQKCLQNCFRSMMTKPTKIIGALIDTYLNRVASLDSEEREKQLAPLVERLHSQFPNDVGCFSVFFLNYLQLEPLQAIFLEANLPHAYLSGDCVECMACSDNVVRAGLTPKFKDVETLCAMLNYEGQPAKSKIFEPSQENEFTQIFRPPVPDFAVAKIQLIQSLKECTLIERDSASIFLVIRGNAKMEQIDVKAGSAVFVPASQPVTLKDVTDGFLAFQALANV